MSLHQMLKEELCSVISRDARWHNAAHSSSQFEDLAIHFSKDSERIDSSTSGQRVFARITDYVTNSLCQTLIIKKLTI
jgi:hypothetical protein